MELDDEWVFYLLQKRNLLCHDFVIVSILFLCGLRGSRVLLNVARSAEIKAAVLPLRRPRVGTNSNDTSDPSVASTACCERDEREGGGRAVLCEPKQIKRCSVARCETMQDATVATREEFYIVFLLVCNLKK